jgi:hypothetical protein
MTTTTDTTADVAAFILAVNLVDGLRAIADLIEARPDQAPRYSSAFNHFNVPVVPCTGTPDVRKGIYSVIDAALANGATAEEWSDPKHAGVVLAFSPAVVAHVYGAKDNIVDPIPSRDVAPFLTAPGATT